MEWDESYSLGIKRIDEQHKKLINILNKLVHAMNEKKANDVLEGILKELTDYTVYHFQTEERYFDEFGYELADEHKQEHKDFTNKVSSFVEEFKSGNALLSIKVLKSINELVRNHLKDTDRKYIKCFKEHGL